MDDNMIYLEENDTTREASRITASMNKTLQKVKASLNKKSQNKDTAEPKKIVVSNRV